METGERCVGNFTIDESLKRAYKETHIEYVELKEIDPETFFESIAEAKKINFFGPFVERRSKDDYRTMQLFTTLDDSAGIAITKEGNIVSVFSKGIHKGVLKTLIPVALSRGGKNWIISIAKDFPRCMQVMDLFRFQELHLIRILLLKIGIMKHLDNLT